MLTTTLTEYYSCGSSSGSPTYRKLSISSLLNPLPQANDNETHFSDVRSGGNLVKQEPEEEDQTSLYEIPKYPQSNNRSPDASQTDMRAKLCLSIQPLANRNIQNLQGATKKEPLDHEKLGTIVWNAADRTVNRFKTFRQRNNLFDRSIQNPWPISDATFVAPPDESDLTFWGKEWHPKHPNWLQRVQHVTPNRLFPYSRYSYDEHSLAASPSPSNCSGLLSSKLKSLDKHLVLSLPSQSPMEGSLCNMPCPKKRKTKGHFRESPEVDRNINMPSLRSRTCITCGKVVRLKVYGRFLKDGQDCVGCKKRNRRDRKNALKRRLLLNVENAKFQNPYRPLEDFIKQRYNVCSSELDFFYEIMAEKYRNSGKGGC